MSDGTTDSGAELILASDWLSHIFNDRDFHECMKNCDDILTKKGADYTGMADLNDRDRQRLYNFYSNAKKQDTTPYKVLQTYMGKHLDSIETFFRRGHVESEPIEQRIFDVINYMLLLYKMIKYEDRLAVQLKHDERTGAQPNTEIKDSSSV